MICDYPEYYEKFACIGEACPDTCCSGWEVDIDEESWYYYMTVKGPLGDRLRSCMREEGGDRFFPLTDKGRCPFLNEQNLCDIICSLGPESICQVCTEYPRYFLPIGKDYEQIDMSLSCMEVGRIFFEDTSPVLYKRALVSEAGEDPTDGLSHSDQEKLQELIRLRTDRIDTLQDRSLPLTSRLDRIFSPYEDSIRESRGILIDVLARMEVLTDKWTALLSEIKENSRLLDQNREAFLAENRENLSLWFEKLAVYLTFRYTLDSFYDKEKAAVPRLIRRSLRLIFRLCLYRRLKMGTFDLQDMIDIAHIYSKQVEHSDINLELMKSPVSK